MAIAQTQLLVQEVTAISSALTIYFLLSSFPISTTPSFNERLSASPSSAVLKRLILVLPTYTPPSITPSVIDVDNMFDSNIDKVSVIDGVIQ
jgi:hypothetical protein